MTGPLSKAHTTHARVHACTLALKHLPAPFCTHAHTHMHAHTHIHTHNHTQVSERVSKQQGATCSVRLFLTYAYVARRLAPADQQAHPDGVMQPTWNKPWLLSALDLSRGVPRAGMRKWRVASMRATRVLATCAAARTMHATFHATEKHTSSGAWIRGASGADAREHASKK